AANASKIDDGAAAVVLASEAAIKRHNLAPIARVVAYAHHAQAPEWFTTAPAFAIEKALARAQLSSTDVGLYEINEAFAVVSLACMQLAHLHACQADHRERLVDLVQTHVVAAQLGARQRLLDRKGGRGREPLGCLRVMRV